MNLLESYIFERKNPNLHIRSECIEGKLFFKIFGHTALGNFFLSPKISNLFFDRLLIFKYFLKLWAHYLKILKFWAKVIKNATSNINLKLKEFSDWAQFLTIDYFFWFLLIFRRKKRIRSAFLNHRFCSCSGFSDSCS